MTKPCLRLVQGASGEIPLYLHAIASNLLEKERYV